MKVKPITEDMLRNMDVDIFWSNVKVGGLEECWPWTGTKTRLGYGQHGKHFLSAHRLMWRIVRGAIPEGLCVLHRCDNPICVNPTHLSVGTHRRNMEEKSERGRCASIVGSKHPMAKLSEDDVFEIRTFWATGKFTQPELAKAFGVSQVNISEIVLRKTWRHVHSNPQHRSTI